MAKKKKTKTEVFEEAVEAMKDIPFDPGTLLLVDEVMLRLIAAWPHVSFEIKDGTEKRTAQGDAWGMIEIEEHEWMCLAGMTWKDYKGARDRLRALDLIYPDGTMPKEVRDMIYWRADDLMGKKKKSK